MDSRNLTDEIIHELLTCQKIVTSKRPRETKKAKHLEKNLDARSEDSAQNFTIITRQSILIPSSFSCGLVWHGQAGQKVILKRYNGSDHAHGNPLEDEEFEGRCHIHVATQRYIQLGRKAELFAQPTTRYRDLSGALKCLLSDCNVSGFGPPSANDFDQYGLF